MAIVTHSQSGRVLIQINPEYGVAKHLLMSDLGYNGRAINLPGREIVTRRFNITAINPSRAMRSARAMLQDWKKLHPSHGYARMLNAQGIELYIVTE